MENKYNWAAVTDCGDHTTEYIYLIIVYKYCMSHDQEDSTE